MTTTTKEKTSEQTEKPEALFADIIRAARARYGISQAELARRCGVSQPAVARWERGARSVSQGVLERVATAFGITARQMVAREVNARRKKPRVAMNGEAIDAPVLDDEIPTPHVAVKPLGDQVPERHVEYDEDLPPE